MSESGFWRWWRPQASAGVVCGQGKRQCQCGMPLLPAGMHSHRQFPSCRQQWLVEYHILSTGMQNKFLPTVMPFPCPRTTPALAGGRRRHHGPWYQKLALPYTPPGSCAPGASPSNTFIHIYMCMCACVRAAAVCQEGFRAREGLRSTPHGRRRAAQLPTRHAPCV
jgi:hypothetical protein